MVRRFAFSWLALSLLGCGSDQPSTPQPSPPAVITGVVTDAGSNGATVNGTVDLFGEAGTYWFDYGTDSTYGSTSDEVMIPAVSPGPQAINESLVGLSPATLYHYRLSARSAGGTSRGSDATLITASQNLPPDTQVVATGIDTVGTQVRSHLFWNGADPDGAVDRFELRMVNHGTDGALDPPDSLNVPWITSSVTDTLFTWMVGLGSRTFFVRAVDDRGLRDPSPAMWTAEVQPDP